MTVRGTDSRGGRGPGAATQPGAQVAQAIAEGQAAFDSGDLMSAHRAFARAHALDRNDPRAMSFHGLTLVLVERSGQQGTLFCEEALRRGGTDPALYLNAARAYLGVGSKRRAVEMLRRGLRASPQEPVLVAEIDRLGHRRRPVLPFLARSNPINRWLGRLRHRLQKNRTEKRT